jgi:pseudoazurin|tara:strand:- start:6449 stop:6880 length:432 start_codon:yes stop_codon:yes gene_type:complete
MKSLFNLLIIMSMLFVAEEHEIKMLNFSESGPMVFEPGFLRIEPGDTVIFKPVDLAHNTETISTMIPDGGQEWLGNINEEVRVTLTTEGVYVYQCTPHLILGMVGVIQVGKPSNLNEVIEASSNMTFAVNPERLSNYLGQVIQ